MINQQYAQEFSKNIESHNFGAPPQQQFDGNYSTGTGLPAEADYEDGSREFYPSNNQPEVDQQQYSQLGSTSPQIFSQHFGQDFQSSPFCHFEQDCPEDRPFSFDEYSGENLVSIHGYHKDNFLSGTEENDLEGALQGNDNVTALFNCIDNNTVPQQESYNFQQNDIAEDNKEELQCVFPSPSTSVGTSSSIKESTTPSNTKRQKKTNVMNKNACEETKNLCNYIVPSIEKGLSAKWGKLKMFKSRMNHKSMVFLNALAKEAEALGQEEFSEFQKDFEQIVKKDLRILSLNQQKMEVTFVLLKYSDSLMMVINNPNRFKSIKKAKESSQLISGRNSRR